MFSQTREFFFDLGEVARDSESDEAKAAGTGRWKLWVECAGFIMEKPVFGWCEDGIADRYSEAGFVQDRPANESLEYAAFYGIPGAAFYLAAVFWIAADACARSGSLHRRRLSVRRRQWDILYLPVLEIPPIM